MVKILFSTSKALALCLFVSISAFAQSKQEADKYVGEWEISIPTAPNGYQSGTTAITALADGRLKGEILLENGDRMSAEFKESKRDTFTSSIYIGGYLLHITLTSRKGEPTATISTGGGDRPFDVTFKKASPAAE